MSDQGVTSCTSYSMSMSKDRRLQVLLETEQYRSIEALAAERRVSVASVVRDALEHYLGAGPDRVRQAADRILQADPMPIGGPDDLRTELEDLRGRRG